ncbi:hypothetical protein P4O66_019663 [Electrophorus voltai]|uniref:Zinc finger protein 40 n=1 Tax=Electrophorus voltai TaxID=2609070 RepID=A0AAD9E7Z8_9TELE|nr:hypothetical protein P4O66_019663 [Electrophorus voltai]
MFNPDCSNKHSSGMYDPGHRNEHSCGTFDPDRSNEHSCRTFKPDRTTKVFLYLHVCEFIFNHVHGTRWHTVSNGYPQLMRKEWRANQTGKVEEEMEIGEVKMMHENAIELESVESVRQREKKRGKRKEREREERKSGREEEVHCHSYISSSDTPMLHPDLSLVNLLNPTVKAHWADWDTVLGSMLSEGFGKLMTMKQDKIEEAQKELKEPRGSQKGRNEGIGRGSDGIKGLKRKKIVAENQLKKIPKSPVKKQPQSKKPVSPSSCTSFKKATSSSLFSKNLIDSSPKSTQDSEDDQQETLSETTVKVENKNLTTLEPKALVHTRGVEQTCVGELVQTKSWSEKTSAKGTTRSRTADPLEVLLKAMEPDFNTLTEKKTCNPIGQLGKSSSIPAAHSEVCVAMPAVNFGSQSQAALMQPYNPDKCQFSNVGSTTVLAALQQSSQQQFIVAADCHHDKPGLQKSYSAGPSLTLTHAPVPSGSNGLPQSQPPVVQTCQSLSATVPNPIQVPVTPGFNSVQLATVVNFGMNQMCDVSGKDQKPKKQGKYVCEYCNRACAKPSVLLKHIRSHTGERPYPCVTCGFSFKTKSNLYKHKKSHAHAIKLGLVSKDSGSGSLSQESDKGLGTHSDVEESGESDEEVSTADLDPDSSQSSLTALSESSLHSSGTIPGSQGEAEQSVVFENLKPFTSQKGCEPKATAALPKVVVYPVNVSPLRADSPRVTDSTPEQATAQRQRDFQTASLRSNITVLSSLKEVDCVSPLQDSISDDEDQQYKSPPGSGHAQLQRQQATDYSQQPQGKCLLSPRSLGSTDSGYFSRSESADQAMSPPSPFVKITPPTESDHMKSPQAVQSPVAATVMHSAPVEKLPVLPGQMRPPFEAKALSLEERISKLISDNEAVVDAKQLDSVKPRRTSLSRRAPPTPNPVVHRTLVRQIAVEDLSTNEGHVLLSVHSMDESHHGPSITQEMRIDTASQISSGSAAVPQILITHEHTLPTSTVASKCTQKLASVSLCPQQEPTASSKRMLSPANSLDIAMEKTQKRAKDDHGAACLTEGRSLNYLNSKMSELTRQRKLMLVRQVCTTEPVDSPIETDAPEQLPESTECEKDNQTSVCHTTMPEDNEQEMESRTPTTTVQPMSVPAMHSLGVQSSSGPGNSALKSQEKPEEQRWCPAKSLVRPPTFQGQVKLASSVSVVNTRDSHRLSFPSLKTATTFTWCFLMKRKPLHIQQTDQRISAYSAWAVKPNNPNPLGLPTKVVMSLFDSKQTSKKILYTQAITTSLKSDILTYSGKLKDILPKVLNQPKLPSSENCSKAKPASELSQETDSSKTEPRRVKIFDGGYKSNEEYVYVRGRGRGKYICEECGIRCKKPSMLRKHIRTHSDVRPYHCAQCNFSFKTKGNLTKHMKSKAHSKKCMEMGVAIGIIEDQETEDSGGRAGSADRPDSDGDDSDGPDDEDNDGEEEDEEDSQAESGLSATPSVSASPQHLSSNQADPVPSSLLAQMSISPSPHHEPLTQAPASESQASDIESVAMTSPVSLVRQMSISASCSSPGPSPSSFTSYPGPASESHASDTESVHMMSPVSPCRQMSIDYPDIDVPPSPPMPGKDSKLGQNGSTGFSSQPTGEPNSNVDRSTQTTSDSLQGPLHFPAPGPSHESAAGSPTPLFSYTQESGAGGPTHLFSHTHESGAGGPTHLFSHLPLHSQQPTRSPYSMVPVGGIQLVPAGLAAYSTFVPIQAGPVQLTIPAVSVIHRQASSPLPAPNTPPRPEGSPTQPLVVQDPVSSVLPCFPLGQVAGLQTLGAPQATLQPVGVETLSVVGLANSTQLVPQQSLALNAALGVQVLAASPAPQCSTASPAHIPGLQILNIALPTLIPSLSPLSTLSPLPLVPDKSSVTLPSPVVESTLDTSPSTNPPTASSRAAPPPPPPAVVAVPVTITPSVEVTLPSKVSSSRDDSMLNSATAENVTPAPQLHPSSSTEGGGECARKAPAVGASETRPPRQPITRQSVTDDYNEASSDDEDRLVIAT